MTDACTSFLMVMPGEDYCQIVAGDGPVQAVVNHYDELNAMCPIVDPEFEEKFSVVLFEIDGDADQVRDALTERIDESDYAGCDALHARLQPGRRRHEVSVLMTARDLEASQSG